MKDLSLAISLLLWKRQQSGVPIPAFEPLLTGRFVAIFRAVIALTCMIALWADPDQPVRYPQAGYNLLGIFLLWAGFNVWASFRNWWVEYYLVRPALLFDVAIAVAAIFFTEGPTEDFATPLAVLLLFTLVEALFVGGWRLASTIGLVFTSGFLLVVALLGFSGEPVDLPRVAGRVSSFLIITALAVWFGGRRTAPIVPAFSVENEASSMSPIAQALAFACQASSGSRGIAHWSDPDSGELRHERWGPGAAHPSSETSITVGAFATASPVLFDSGKDHALRLDAGDRFVASAAGPQLAGAPATGSVLAIPVHSSNLRALLFISGLSKPGPDLLPIARNIAREIETGLDRHRLALVALEDRLGEVRRSVARDLHDSVAQSLAGGSFRVEAARNNLANGADPAMELKAVHEALQTEQRYVRRIIERLREGGAIRLRHDLGTDLAGLAGDVAKQWNIAVSMAPSETSVEVGTSQLHEIRQIVREAVANAARHGQASRVDVSIEAEQRCFRIDIIDNGHGGHTTGSASPFRPESIAARVATLGGSLDARRGPSGTRLYITVPRLSA